MRRRKTLRLRERAPLVVALDGSGQYRSIQEAVDAAKKGDTILIRPGAYPEDVTIHSKENVRLIGAAWTKSRSWGVNG